MFTLVIDETRSHLLQMMFNHCGGGKGSEHFLEVLVGKDEVYQEELVAFLKDFVEKVHENNYCMDPDCKYGK